MQAMMATPRPRQVMAVNWSAWESAPRRTISSSKADPVRPVLDQGRALGGLMVGALDAASPLLPGGHFLFKWSLEASLAALRVNWRAPQRKPETSLALQGAFSDASQHESDRQDLRPRRVRGGPGEDQGVRARGGRDQSGA